jgi:hypothetical protein
MTFFHNTPFWQCPSYTITSFVLGLIVALIVGIIAMVSTDMAKYAGAAGGIFMFLWVLYVFYSTFIDVNEGCRPKGFESNHWANPFATKP